MAFAAIMKSYIAFKSLTEPHGRNTNSYLENMDVLLEGEWGEHFELSGLVGVQTVNGFLT